MSQETIAVDIGSNCIKILVGSSTKITYCGLIKTPENSVTDGKLTNIEAIYEVIHNFLSEKNIKTKFIKFAIHGQDIIARHVESPIMDAKSLDDSVRWEISQYLPQNGEGHYIDFEILDKISNSEKKVYKILVVAVPREKVEDYVRLADKLNLTFKALDISSNCISRVYKDLYKKNKTESIGVIDIGSKSSSLIIVDKGKLFIEREVAFGMNSIVKEISQSFDMDEEKAYNYFLTNFNFSRIDEESAIQNRIKSLFDNVFINFDKIIQFYSAGKSKKALDQIFIIGAGCEIYGMDNYIKQHFGASVSLVRSTEDISSKTLFPTSCDFKFYVNTFGLILRNDASSELNVLPYSMRDKKYSSKISQIAAIITLIVLAVMILGYAGAKYALAAVNNKQQNLKAQEDNYNKIILADAKLQNQYSQLNNFITFYQKLQKQNVSVSDTIHELEKSMPQDVTYKSISYDKNQIVISANAEKYNSACEQIANLELTDQFKNTKMQSINYNSGSKSYDFNIQITLSGGENSAK